MKFKITKITKNFKGTPLHKIKYVNGDWGGWIEKEENIDEKCFLDNSL